MSEAQPSHTVPVISTIEEMVKDIQGWCPTDQLYTLFIIAFLTKDLPGDIVEIGSWCGKSTTALGLAARLIGNTKVHCIDLWPEKSDWFQNPDGTYAFQVTIDGQIFKAHEEQLVWKEPFETQSVLAYEHSDSTFEVFRANITKNSLENVIEPHRGDSSYFLYKISPDFQCKMAFIDGDHGYTATCKDIANVEKVLIPGGWICFDDAFSCYEGVNRAVQELIISSGKYDLFQQMTRKLFIARKK